EAEPLGTLRYVRQCLGVVRGCLRPEVLSDKSGSRSTWAAQSWKGCETGAARRKLEGQRGDVPRHRAPGGAHRRYRCLFCDRLLRPPLCAACHLRRTGPAPQLQQEGVTEAGEGSLSSPARRKSESCSSTPFPFCSLCWWCCRCSLRCAKRRSGFPGCWPP